MEFRKSNTPAILVNLLTLLQLVINDSKFVSFYSSFIPWYQSNKISRDFRLTTRWEPNSKRHVFSTLLSLYLFQITWHTRKSQIFHYRRSSYSCSTTTHYRIMTYSSQVIWNWVMVRDVSKPVSFYKKVNSLLNLFIKLLKRLRCLWQNNYFVISICNHWEFVHR